MADQLQHQHQHQHRTLSPTAPQFDHGVSSYQGSGQLDGRRALITGGCSGIGRAVAIAYAREGADVTIVHPPEDQADARSTAQLVEQAGRTATLLAADLQSERACVDTIAEAVAAMGGLDILVLNAAYQQYRHGFAAMNREDAERALRTDLFSMIWLLREALQHLDFGSSIITTTSIESRRPSPGLVDCAMTVSAQVAFTSALADELEPQGIRVNAVVPGPTRTLLISTTDWLEGELGSFGADVPRGRVGNAADLAATYVLLASTSGSDDASTTLRVAGGPHR